MRLCLKVMLSCAMPTDHIANETSPEYRTVLSSTSTFRCYRTFDRTHVNDGAEVSQTEDGPSNSVHAPGHGWMDVYSICPRPIALQSPHRGRDTELPIQSPTQPKTHRLRFPPTQITPAEASSAPVGRPGAADSPVSPTSACALDATVDPPPRGVAGRPSRGARQGAG